MASSPYPRETSPVVPPMHFRTKKQRATREYVYRRDNFTCRHCGAKADPPPEDWDGRFTLNCSPSPTGLDWNFLQLDHITPRSKGGTHSEWNLQTLCYSCNAAKCDRDPGALV